MLNPNEFEIEEMEVPEWVFDEDDEEDGYYEENDFEEGYYWYDIGYDPKWNNVNPGV